MFQEKNKKAKGIHQFSDKKPKTRAGGLQDRREQLRSLVPGTGAVPQISRGRRQHRGLPPSHTSLSPPRGVATY